MVAATPFFGPEIKGARRWLVLFGVNIQPSEFLKPAFVIIVAWLFGESAKRPDMPANTFSLILLLTVVALLVLQPDFGQTMLIALVWSALFFMAGMRWSGCRHCRTRRRRACSARTTRCRTSRAAFSVSSIRRRAIPLTSTSRPKASCAAAGSARDRARGP